MPEESSNQAIPLREYLDSIDNSSIVFVLRDFVGNLVNTQMVSSADITIHSSKRLGARFIVDELLTSRMIPGTYKLYAYIAYPKEGANAPYLIADYVLDKCLTEQGIKIKVNGGLNQPSVGI